MAIFHITPATSRFSSTGNAFGPPADDTPGADTLIVDPGAFLISTGAGGDGAFLANTGSWAVTVNGSIVSPNGSGIFLDAGNAAFSTIKIGVDGQVQGGGIGIFLESSANINNAGTIVADPALGGIGINISNGGTHKITNSGEINAAPGFAIKDQSSSNDTVYNSGTIRGQINLSGGNDTVTNTGTITDIIFLGDGTNRLTNSGTIFFTFGGTGNDTVTNSNLINGNLSLDDGAGPRHQLRHDRECLWRQRRRHDDEFCNHRGCH
jgi:hypothetical protein